MKPWSERTRKDKTARILASIYVLGTLLIGTPIVVRDTYDYIVAGPCRDGIETAFAVYVEKSEAIDKGDLAAAFRAESAALMAMHDAIAALVCPTEVERQRAAFLASLHSLADLLDGFASGSSYNPVTEQTAYNQAGKDLTILREVLNR